MRLTKDKRRLSPEEILQYQRSWRRRRETVSDRVHHRGSGGRASVREPQLS